MHAPTHALCGCAAYNDNVLWELGAHFGNRGIEHLGVAIGNIEADELDLWNGSEDVGQLGNVSLGSTTAHSDVLQTNKHNQRISTTSRVYLLAIK
jgi:hypothetical protein